MKIKIRKLLLSLACVALLTVSLSLTASAASDINEMGFSFTENDGAVYLYNYDSDRVLVSVGADKISLPVSSAKMMAGLLVCESYADRLDERVIITEEMLRGVEGTSMKLRLGMEVSLRELLWGTLCGGNNDAATAMAVYCGGSVSGFVNQMNTFAVRLNMVNTQYKNPTGLDAEGAKTTLADFAKLARRAAKNETYVEISSAPSFTFTPSGEAEITVYNRNALASQFSATGYINKHAKGLISGNTDGGGYVLATLAQKDGVSFLCVIMGAQSDANNIYSYRTANKLLDYVFNHYSFKKIASVGQQFTTAEIEYTLAKGEKISLPCVVSSELYAFLEDDVSVKNDLTYKTYLHSKPLSAPISQGDVVGGLDVYLGERLICRAKLVANEDVEANFILDTVRVMKSVVFSRVFIIGSVLSVLSIVACLYFENSIMRRKKAVRSRFKKL